MYLIDKIVRAKALKGPIGVDNSEVINIEQEKELRKRDKYYADLAEKKQRATADEQAAENSDNDDFDEDDEDQMDPQTRENIVNEKLLKRLYKAA